MNKCDKYYVVFQKHISQNQYESQHNVNLNMTISMLVQDIKRRNHLFILEGVVTYFVQNVNF